MSSIPIQLKSSLVQDAVDIRAETRLAAEHDQELGQLLHSKNLGVLAHSRTSSEPPGDLPERLQHNVEVLRLSPSRKVLVVLEEFLIDLPVLVEVSMDLEAHRVGNAGYIQQLSKSVPPAVRVQGDSVRVASLEVDKPLDEREHRFGTDALILLASKLTEPGLGGFGKDPRVLFVEVRSDDLEASRGRSYTTSALPHQSGPV